MSNGRPTSRNLVLALVAGAVCVLALVIAIVFDAPTSTNLLLLICFAGAGLAIYYGTRRGAP